MIRLREWTRRLAGAFGGRRSDRDLKRELADHVAFAEEEFLRKGHAPADAARLARASAGGGVQALEALRDQRGLPWVASSLLDIRLGLRLLIKSWGLTLTGGLATALAISIAAIVFTAFDVVMWSPLPLDEGDRVVAIQVWDREAGRRLDAARQDFDRWRTALQTIKDVAAFQTIRRNVIAPDGSVELASIAEISGAGFQVARVAPIMGRAILDADAAPGAPAIVVIGHDVWQRRFAGAYDVIGRELRLGTTVHTIVGVMPAGFQFPVNFRYWVPLRDEAGPTLKNTGPEGVVFGRLSPGVSIDRAHAEVAALGLLPAGAALENPAATTARVVPYTFAFTGDFERGEAGFAWSMLSLMLVLLLLPPCANIAILNYARTVTRQQEFAARHALGGSRARIVWQLFLESLVLTSAAAGAALIVLRLVAVIAAERLQAIPGGPPFWLTLDISYRTLVFVGGLALAGAAVSGLVPALQATRRLSRLWAGALAGRTSVRLGATWTTLVVAQVAFSVGVLPIAAELAWGTLRTGITGPGFAAEQYVTARVMQERNGDFAPRERELVRRLVSDARIEGVAAAMQPPGEEPWMFVDIEGVEAPTETINGRLPGFPARFNRIDASFLDLYQVPVFAGRRFTEADDAQGTAVIVNRNFAETIAPGGNALGRRFRYARAMDDDAKDAFDATRWYEVVGVVGNLPVSTDARIAYHAARPGELNPAHLQLRLGADSAGMAERIREAAASVDPTLHVDEVRTLAEIYREHRFGDTVGAITIAAVTGSVLLLSAAGLYALMAFTVAQRRREIGIRSALGAQPRHLVASVFKRAFLQIAGGSAVGVLAAYAAGRYVPIEQVGGLPIPGILPGAVALMLLVGVFAALGPARGGLRIDPTQALRSD